MMDVGAVVTIGKGKLLGQHGAVVEKGRQGWYKVQVSGVEGVTSFRAADLSAVDGSAPPREQPASPLKKNASKSPAAMAAAAAFAETPGRRVSARQEPGFPPRHPASDEPVSSRRSSRRRSGPGSNKKHTGRDGTSSAADDSSQDGGCDAEPEEGVGVVQVIESTGGNTGDMDVEPEGQGPESKEEKAGHEEEDEEREGDRSSDVEDSGGGEEESMGAEMPVTGGADDSGKDEGGTEQEPEQEAEADNDKEDEDEGEDTVTDVEEGGEADQADSDEEDEEEEEEEEEEEDSDEEEEEEEVGLEEMVRLAATAAATATAVRKPTSTLASVTGGRGSSAPGKRPADSNGGEEGARKRQRRKGGPLMMLDSGLPSPKYLHFSGKGKGGSSTASVLSDPVASKTTKLMAGSALYSGRDRAMLLEKTKAPKDDTAGKGWFHMEQAEMTPELKRDLQVIRMRNFIDPKRFYKASDKTSKFMQIGTVKEGPAEYYSSRLTNKERKKTLVDELLVADDAFRAYSKNQYGSIQSKKRAGGKAQYNELRRKRKGGMKWNP